MDFKSGRYRDPQCHFTLLTYALQTNLGWSPRTCLYYNSGIINNRILLFEIRDQHIPFYTGSLVQGLTLWISPCICIYSRANRKQVPRLIWLSAFFGLGRRNCVSCLHREKKERKRMKSTTNQFGVNEYQLVRTTFPREGISYLSLLRRQTTHRTYIHCCASCTACTTWFFGVCEWRGKRVQLALLARYFRGHFNYVQTHAERLQDLRNSATKQPINRYNSYDSTDRQERKESAGEKNQWDVNQSYEAGSGRDWIFLTHATCKLLFRQNKN